MTRDEAGNVYAMIFTVAIIACLLGFVVGVVLEQNDMEGSIIRHNAGYYSIDPVTGKTKFIIRDFKDEPKSN
jgi:hypothetical protein